MPCLAANGVFQQADDSQAFRLANELLASGGGELKPEGNSKTGVLWNSINPCCSGSSCVPLTSLLLPWPSCKRFCRGLGVWDLEGTMGSVGAVEDEVMLQVLSRLLVTCTVHSAVTFRLLVMMWRAVAMGMVSHANSQHALTGRVASSACHCYQKLHGLQEEHGNKEFASSRAAAGVLV